MATILLAVIYLAFISLGIPDSLFGVAWPAIYEEFQLPVSFAGFVTFTISGCTILSSLSSTRLISKFGTGVVTAMSIVMTAVALLGFSVSQHLLWLCLFSIPLGLGAGCVDTALNHYVAIHYKASHMNILHCFYGVGVTLSPYLMSLALSKQNNWRKGYFIMFIIQGLIALLSLTSLPLWSKKTDEAATKSCKNMSMKDLLRTSGVKSVCMMFISSCALEYTVGTWGSTFLVDYKGVSIENAAQWIILYYLGMVLGRLLSGLLANKFSSWKLIQFGMGSVAFSILFLFLPFPSIFSALSLFLIGFGNGPIFPNLIYLTPKHFGKEYSQLIMGIQMAASYIGITFIPPLFGIAAQIWGIWLFPYGLLLLFMILFLSKIYLIRFLKRKKFSTK